MAESDTKSNVDGGCRISKEARLHLVRRAGYLSHGQWHTDFFLQLRNLGDSPRSKY